MARCEQGHFFDERKHVGCPFCAVLARAMGLTPAAKSAPACLPEEDRTRRRQTRPAADRRTVSILQQRTGFDPVVGWLVCVEGPDRGRDYRLHSENNFIGRDPGMDVCISGDGAVSRHKHAVLSFDPASNDFELSPGESRRLVYLNERRVNAPVSIDIYDAIGLGRTTLLFMPFCSDQFRWE